MISCLGALWMIVFSVATGLISFSVVVAMSLVALTTVVCGELGIDFKIFKTTRIFVIVILFGAGTDYCLFLIARYKEELQRGLSVQAAVEESLAKVGDALVASALTTILGIGAMVFCDFGKFRNSGPAIALCLLVALAASLTLAPALLRMAGRAVFWPWGVGASASDSERQRSLAGRFWESLSGRIVAYPGLIFVGSLVILLPLASLGLETQRTYDLLSELRADRPVSPRELEATVLLERDGAAPLVDDLAIALERAVAVVDARTRLVLGTTEQLGVLLQGDDPELAVLALEWVRDRAERRHLDDVLRLLEGDDERVFGAAVEALGAVGGPEQFCPPHEHRLGSRQTVGFVNALSKLNWHGCLLALGI